MFIDLEVHLTHLFRPFSHYFYLFRDKKFNLIDTSVYKLLVGFLLVYDVNMLVFYDSCCQ